MLLCINKHQFKCHVVTFALLKGWHKTKASPNGGSLMMRIQIVRAAIFLHLLPVTCHDYNISTRADLHTIMVITARVGICLHMHILNTYGKRPPEKHSFHGNLTMQCILKPHHSAALITASTWSTEGLQSMTNLNPRTRKLKFTSRCFRCSK